MTTARTKDGLSSSRLNPPKDSILDPGLLHAFQQNLLSLLSHELRTPLTGIQNALTMLEIGNAVMPPAEALDIAKKNVSKLGRLFDDIFDLAAMGAGVFRVRLREAELSRLVGTRIPSLKERFPNLKISMMTQQSDLPAARVLADHFRLGRALDLVTEIIDTFSRGQVGVAVSDYMIRLRFKIAGQKQNEWEKLVKEEMCRTDLSTTEVLQAVTSESAFLARTQEGMGAGFSILKQILDRHSATIRVDIGKDGGFTAITMVFPAVQGEDRFLLALESRLDGGVGIGMTAIAILEAPSSVPACEFSNSIRSALFRSTDSLYSLNENGDRLALLLDDCKADDVKGLIARLKTSTGSRFRSGFAVYPSDGTTASILFGKALERLKNVKGEKN